MKQDLISATHWVKLIQFLSKQSKDKKGAAATQR